MLVEASPPRRAPTIERKETRMQRLYLVRPVKSVPLPSEKRSAKVIELRVRREARRDARRPPRPDRPDAA